MFGSLIFNYDFFAPNFVGQEFWGVFFVPGLCRILQRMPQIDEIEECYFHFVSRASLADVSSPTRCAKRLSTVYYVGGKCLQF